jgi:outer membrane biosynthesis protein TonB
MNRRQSSRLSAGAVLVLAVLCAGAMDQGHAQAIQKWVDEKGVVHYGDAPPPEAKPKSVKVQKAPPAEAAPRPSDTQAKTLLDQAADRNTTAKEKEAAAEAQRAADAQRAAAVEAATNSRRVEECNKRIAALQREVRNHRNFSKNYPNAAADRQLDEFAAKEDAWIAKNCGDK